MKFWTNQLAKLEYNLPIRGVVVEWIRRQTLDHKVRSFESLRGTYVL